MIAIIYHITLRAILAEPSGARGDSARTRMSDSPTERESTSEPPESPLDSDRYTHLSLDDDAVGIYDREDPDTWVQSNLFVGFGA